MAPLFAVLVPWLGPWHCSVSAAQPIQLICLLIPHGLVRLIECSPSGPQHSQVPSPGVFDPGWTLSLDVFMMRDECDAAIFRVHFTEKEVSAVVVGCQIMRFIVA